MAGMRLLTPTEAQKQRALTQHVDIIRAQEISGLLTKKNREYAHSEASFQALLLSQRERWAKEEKNHADWVDKTEKEIKELEARKQAALSPIEEFRKDVENKMRETEEFLSRVQQKEKDADQLMDMLDSRLADADSAKLAYEDKFSALDSREQAVKRQENNLHVGAAELTKGISEHLEEKVLFQKEKEEEKARWLTRNVVADARDLGLSKKEVALQAGRALLKDREAMFERDKTRNG